ncbi:PQQ-dependent sugar dehydrogenase [Natronolimnohabitans innermongolicus]|uniref:Glucose sorbosone dehydrogenase n=1 Tax=Natronolimnohabitans innermongolicus JCM 12255 TaxID=1227499 RepID=L9WQP1_9EURY|nr:PQQ-dependent sugar dehydrogenase [Natronolimnohabitans innermongolicus]ELY51717.1 glucose sorbosone dehydrogenase [Natronolimnohabitans innermongolicus JCM 12255]
MSTPEYTRRSLLAAGATAGALSVAGCTSLLDDEDDFPGEVETVVDGLAHPWALEFVPDEPWLLVTEREGALRLIDREEDEAATIDGTPDVFAEGQGGLLDVALHPDFDEEPWVYLTYAATNDDGESATHLGRGRLEVDDDGEGGALEEFEELHVAEPFVEDSGHFGSRAVFGPDGALYVTTGDRQFKDFGPEHVSQDPTNELGATLRLEPDGSVPDDNPFVDSEGTELPRADGDAVDGDDVEDAIYSYGHRNVQGMTVHPETDEIWQSEHGEEDGDELNVLEEGGNYGWPIAHTGCEYGTDEPVGDDPFDDDDIVDPVYYWECNSGGFPPAGMTFYDGDAFEDWQGDLFVGNLAGEYLGRFSVDGTDVEETDQLLETRGWRIRDVAVAPDTDYIYVAVDDADAPIVRLVPE